MKRLGKQLHNATEDVVLTQETKAQMRERLCVYMREHPVEVEEWPLLSPLQMSVARLPWVFRFTPFSTSRYVSGAFALTLIFLLGTGSVSYAAEDALPGDLLYPVKVRVNEEVQGVFVSSEEEKVAWAKERAERRVSEASTLATQGKLDAEKKETVAQLISEHTQEAVAGIRSLEEKDPVLGTELSDDLASSLKEHGDTLARIVVEDNTQADSASRGLIQSVQQAVAEVKDVRAETEAKLNLTEEETMSAVVEKGEVATSSLVAYTPDETKISSPDMRVRAVYRMQKNAHDTLAQAKEALGHLDADTPAYIQVSEEYADLEKQIAQADALLAQGLLGNGYRIFVATQERVQALMQALATPNVPVQEEMSTSTLEEESTSSTEGAETRALKRRELVQEKLLALASSTEGAEARANAFQGEVAYEAGMYAIATDYFKKAESLLREKEATSSEGVKENKGEEKQKEEREGAGN